MAHKFDEKKMKKLDNTERRKIMPAKEILMNLGLKEEDTFADIGCGIGYFSIPACKIVGEKGKVYGIDISDVMLHECKKKIDELEIKNMKLLKSTEYSLGIKPKEISFAFMCNVLHEIEDKEKFIKEIKETLKEKGKLAIIDWQKKETKKGPPIEERLEKEEVRKLLENHGFIDIKVTDISQEFYSVIGVSK